MMLYKLAVSMNPDEFENAVVSLSGTGALGERLRSAGVAVSSLGIDRKLPNPFALLKLRRIVRDFRPHVLQTWMYHADLLGGLLLKLSGDKTPVIWNIRQSSLDSHTMPGKIIRLARLCAKLSHSLPVKILSNAESAKEAHIAIGYENSKFEVIPNGFDLGRMARNEELRQRTRSELKILNGTLLIGSIGRLDPLKDYRTFIEACSIVARKHPNTEYILCGKDLTSDNRQLASWKEEFGLNNPLHLMGGQTDPVPFLNAMDIFCLTSLTEGFPNVLGEAMSCELPCVATDAGDSRILLGDPSMVVPPRSPRQFAERVCALIEMSPEQRRDLGKSARKRIQVNFELGAIARRYEAVYRDAARPQPEKA